MAQRLEIDLPESLDERRHAEKRGRGVEAIQLRLRDSRDQLHAGYLAGEGLDAGLDHAAHQREPGLPRPELRRPPRVQEVVQSLSLDPRAYEEDMEPATPVRGTRDRRRQVDPVGNDGDALARGADVGQAFLRERARADDVIGMHPALVVIGLGSGRLLRDDAIAEGEAFARAALGVGHQDRTLESRMRVELEEHLERAMLVAFAEGGHRVGGVEEEVRAMLARDACRRAGIHRVEMHVRGRRGTTRPDEELLEHSAAEKAFDSLERYAVLRSA
jgi:hypothetical protein